MYIHNTSTSYKIRNDIAFLNNDINYNNCMFIEFFNNTYDANHKQVIKGSIYISPDPSIRNIFIQDIDSIMK